MSPEPYPASGRGRAANRPRGGCFLQPGARPRFRLPGGYLKRVDTDTLHREMHVVAPGRAASKMCAAVRAVRGRPRNAVREFSALPDGLRAIELRSHGVTAAAMEGTGVYWTPFEAQDASRRPAQCPARQADPREEDGQRQPVAGPHGSVLRYRATAPSHSASAQLTRYRRARRRAQPDPQPAKPSTTTLTVLSATNGRRILDGLVAEVILAGLTSAAKLEPWRRAATLDPLALLTPSTVATLDRKPGAPCSCCKRFRDLGACTLFGDRHRTSPSARRVISAPGPEWPRAQHQRRQTPFRKGNPTLRATLADAPTAPRGPKARSSAGRIGYRAILVAIHAYCVTVHRPSTTSSSSSSAAPRWIACV